MDPKMDTNDKYILPKIPSGQDQAEGFAGTSLPSNLSPLERKTPGRSSKPVS